LARILLIENMAPNLRFDWSQFTSKQLYKMQASKHLKIQKGAENANDESEEGHSPSLQLDKEEINQLYQRLNLTCDQEINAIGLQLAKHIIDENVVSNQITSALKNDKGSIIFPKNDAIYAKVFTNE
jgi:hypothetical protein